MVKSEFGFGQSLKLYGPPTTNHRPKFLSMKKNPGGLQEREHGVAHHVQGVHYQERFQKSLSGSEWFSW